MKLLSYGNGNIGMKGETLIPRLMRMYVRCVACINSGAYTLVHFSATSYHNKTSYRAINLSLFDLFLVLSMYWNIIKSFTTSIVDIALAVAHHTKIFCLLHSIWTFPLSSFFCSFFARLLSFIYKLTLL